jgi:bifunctional ADP-heptose synthase (sugar kinase/adenylyltransferase)
MYVNGKTIKSFTLTKIIDYENDDVAKIVYENLNRLKTENFNRILIPNYHHEIKGSTVTIISDYIKGFYSEDRNIIIEDVVMHESEYTFNDYHRQNYIVCDNTEMIYMVDLESYCHFPSIDKRYEYFKKDWNAWWS